jgi:hypothetical protein
LITKLVALIGTFGLLVAGSLFLPTQSLQIGIDPLDSSYSVKAVDQLLVCPGAIVRSGGEKGTKLGVFDRLGQASISVTADGAGTGVLETSKLVSPTKLNSSELPEDRLFSETSESEALSLKISGRTDETDQGSSLLIASQSQLVVSDSIKGLASTNCQQPTSEFWLVGGSTAAGRESLLILTNPSPIDATADLRIFSNLGEVKVGGLSGISVLANSTLIVSLASYAPDVKELAVQVKSQAAKLAGWIQQKAIRGTSAAGLDIISPESNLSTSKVIPGFVIRGSKDSKKLFNISDDYFDVRNIIRVFAPEGQAANITIQVIATASDTFGAVLTGVVEPGTVQDFNIDDLEDGEYSVFISSDQPILASARAVRSDPEANPGTDFVWLSSAEEISNPRTIAAPALGQKILVLANSSDQIVSTSVLDLISGETKLVSIPAFGTASIEVLNSVSISPNDGFVFGSLVILSEGQISSVSITDPKNIGSDVQVNFR